MKFSHHDILKNRLYNDLAEYYECVISKENYQGEVAFWLQVMAQHCQHPLPKMLELASGPGHLLSYLNHHVDATVLDLSQPMLDQCQVLNPGVKAIQGDITRFNLQQNYDFILLHDSIGHLFKVSDIQSTFENAYNHLQPGGIFAVSPEFDDDDFNKPMVYHRTMPINQQDLTVIDFIERHPSDHHRLNVLTSYYIQKNGKTDIEFDRMELGLFGIQFYKNIMEKTGFHVELYTKPEGSSTECRTVLVGTKAD